VNGNGYDSIDRGDGAKSEAGPIIDSCPDTAPGHIDRGGTSGLLRLHDQGLGEMAYREFMRRNVRRRPPRLDSRPAVSRLSADELVTPANCNMPPGSSDPAAR